MVCESHDRLIEKIEELTKIVIRIDTTINNGMKKEIENSRSNIKMLFEKRESDLIEIERLKTQLKVYGFFVIPVITGSISFIFQRFLR